MSTSTGVPAGGTARAAAGRSVERSDPATRRILFVSPTPHWVGATNSLLFLVGYLRERFDVTVAVPGGGIFSEALDREGIPRMQLRSLTKWAIPSLMRLVRGFDLVYANNTSGASRNAILAAALARVPSVCHVRSIVTNQSALTLSYLNLTTAVIAISRACADSLRGKVPQRKVHVVYNGTDVDGFSKAEPATRARLRRELGVEGAAPLIMYVGHIKRRKGQEHAVRAVADLRRSGRDVHLVLVGALDREPDYLAEIRWLIEELRLEDRVTLTGFRRDVSALLSIADAYLHTCVEEAFGRAVIEAMAAQLPVVAFDVGGVGEIVVDGEMGVLAPSGDSSALADALSSLLADPTLRERMGAAGRRRVEEQFSADATARRVGAILERALKSA